jgi:hypothetical protein
MAPEHSQGDVLSSFGDLDLVRLLLVDLHDDLPGKVARFRQLTDLSGVLGPSGTMLFGGEVTYAAWTEARSSFVHGNFVATVLLCQGLVEHLLAAFLHGALLVENLPSRISFAESLRRCEERHVISAQDAQDLRRLMELRNPLSHFRSLDDPSNLSRRVLDTMVKADHHLFRDASFAIGVAIRVLALPAFRLGK